MDVITYPCWDLTMLVKGAPDDVVTSNQANVNSSSSRSFIFVFVRKYPRYKYNGYND